MTTNKYGWPPFSLVVAAAITAVFLAGNVSAEEEERPRIVVVLADDHGVSPQQATDDDAEQLGEALSLPDPRPPRTSRFESRGDLVGARGGIVGLRRPALLLGN